MANFPLIRTFITNTTRAIGKKILFSFFALFLAYRSYELLEQLPRIGKEIGPGMSLFIAFLINLFITGIFAFPGFVFPTHRLLPAAYYRIRSPKLLQRAYVLFGLKYFRIFLMLFFWGRPKHRATFFNGKRSGIQGMMYQCKQSEFGHFGAGITILICSFWLLEPQFSTLLVATQIINLIGNFYPVVLQRHHRMRIDRINSIAP